MLFNRLYGYRNAVFLGQWCHSLVLWGGVNSENNSSISHPALFLVYFLGAFCSFPTSSVIYLFAFISSYSLHCVGRRNRKTEDKTAVLLPLLTSL